ncbi:hypothetical protein [Cupriavidus basilensis]
MIGAQGILDYAINKANAQAIVERLQRQDFSVVKALPQEFAKGLESRQIKVVLVPEPLDMEQLKKFTEGSGDGVAEMDYRPLAKQYGADRLLLVAPRWLGTARQYYGFMPLGAPEGYVSLVGQLIDLRTNRLQWYEPVRVNTPVTGEWDEAPEYANLMKSVDESTQAAVSKAARGVLHGAGDESSDCRCFGSPGSAINTGMVARAPGRLAGASCRMSCGARRLGWRL